MEKVETGQETLNCGPSKNRNVNMEDDDDDDEVVTSSQNKLIISFSESQNDSKSFKSWDFKRKPSRTFSDDTEPIENHLGTDESPLNDNSEKAACSKSDLGQHCDVSPGKPELYEIKKIRSPSNWKNFKQFIFLGHSRFVFNNNMPGCEGLPHFQVLIDPELKIDSLESVLRNHDVDFKKDTLLLCSIGIEDFLDIELFKRQNQAQEEDLSLARVIAKAKHTMKKLRRMFTKDSESFLVNALPVNLKESNPDEKISHLDLISLNINDSMRTFNNYVKLSVPQKLRENLPDFPDASSDASFINKYTSDGLNLTKCAIDQISRVIVINIKNYISFKGLFRNIVLVGDSYLENVVKVWPGDRFNCTVFVVPSYKMTDMRVGSALWRALKEYKNALIILNLSILDLYDNQYISCPECKMTLKFLVPKTLSVSKEVLLEKVKSTMERVELVAMNSLDNCKVLFGHSNVIDVQAHCEYVILKHKDTCDYKNLQMFDPISQESKTAISELFNLVESCNEYASIRNKSNWLPVWDKLPFIYGHEYKKSNLLPYSFPTDTFIDGINLSPDVARRIAEYFYFTTEDIIKLKPSSERKDFEKPVAAELEVSKKGVGENSISSKITGERHAKVPIQITCQNKKPTQPAKTNEGNLTCKKRRPKQPAKTNEGNSVPLPSSSGFHPFIPPNLFSIRFDSCPPPPYEGGFVGYDITENSGTASMSSQYPMYGGVSASWNNQPSGCAPWNWPDDSQGIFGSGETYSNNTPYIGLADPYSIPQIGQAVSHTYSSVESPALPEDFTQGSTLPDHSSLQQPYQFYPEPSSRLEETHYSTNHQQIERSLQPDIHGINSTVSSWHERPSHSQSPQVSRILSSTLSLRNHDKTSLDLDERKLKALSFLRDGHEREWEAYKKLLKTHPNYAEEQTNFIRSKVKNILDRGQKPNMDIILKNWEDYWEKHLVELSEDSWATKRENLIAALNSDNKRSRFSDSFVSRSSESSFSESSEGSRSSDSEDHRRFRKSKRKKEVRRQERRSSSTLDRRGIGIRERRNSDISAEFEFAESDAHTKGKKRCYTTLEEKVDSLRKRKHYHTDGKSNLSGKEMSYAPSDRENESARKGQSFTRKYSHSSHDKVEESCSYDRTRIKDPENYRKDIILREVGDDRANPLHLDGKNSSISKENSTSGPHGDLAFLEYIMKVKSSTSSQLSTSKVHGSEDLQSKQAEISVSEFVVGEWMKESLYKSANLGDGKNDDGSKKLTTSSSSLSNRSSESTRDLFVKTNAHCQDSTGELFPKNQKLGPEPTSKLRRGNNETVLSGSKKSCNIVEVFEVLNRFSDDLGNLKRPLELLHVRAMQINSADKDVTSLLHDSDNLTLMHMISSKLKKSVKSADLSVIQKVVIEEALERLDNFLENSLPEVDVKSIAVECLGRSDEKIREYITKELVTAFDFPTTGNQITKILKNVKEEQLKLLNILRLSKSLKAREMSLQDHPFAS